MTTLSAVCPLHIGRAAEVERLMLAADRRIMTLIAGEAGVGKSRLAGEAMRLGSGRGLGQLVGQCTPEATVPYAPFVSAVRRRTRTMETDELRRLFEGPALLAASLLPEAASAAGLPKDAPRQEDLFAAVWHVLNRLAKPGGTVLVLEDLHWADTDSLRMLSYLAREMDDLPVWLVATYRSDELHRRHPLTAVLAELGRLRLYEEIALRPLGRDDLSLMVSAIFDGTEVSGEFVDVLYERTSGNPFFAEEVVKVLLDRGDIYRGAGDWERRELVDIEMPVTVRETLLARTRNLTSAQMVMFELAALVGDQLDLAVLAHATGLDAGAINEAVAHGLGLQLLVERRDGGTVAYYFRHALTREAFADELVGPDRQRAHRRIAEAILAVHSGDLDRFAAELADHYAEAGDTGAAIEFGIRAARFAVARSALHEAGRRYERTLQLMAREGPERLALLVEAGEVMADIRNGPLLVSFATEGRELARALADPVSEARALNALQSEAWNVGDTPRALSLSRESFALVHGKDDDQEARVIARLARLLDLSGHYDEAEQLIEPGVELATRSGNLSALSRIYGTRMMLAFHGPAFEAALEAAVDAARMSRDEVSELNVVTNAGYMTLWCGELLRSQELLTRAMELSQRLTPLDGYAAAGHMWLLSLLGRYDEVLERSRLLGTAAMVPTRIVALTARYEAAERSDHPDTGDIVDELWSLAVSTGETQRSVPAMAAKARYTLLAGDENAAEALFWETLNLTSADRGTGSHWMFSPDLARHLFRQGRSADLQQWADAVQQLTDRDRTPHNEAAGALTTALARGASGDLSSGRRLFDEAAHRFVAMSCPAREAEAWIGLADLEWQADAPEASALAARRALRLAETIGATAVARRASEAAARAEAPSVLATVLFTDIVSSTERLSTVGDRAWTAVLERHHALVRRQLDQYRGREIDTTGDGFLATFDSPAQGIRCAVAIRDALAAAGINVRAGLHTGECQMLGKQLAGLAVHIAARVSAAAEGGEILVSGTVRDLVAGSGLTFVDHGTRKLKGVPGEWAIFRVA